MKTNKFTTSYLINRKKASAAITMLLCPYTCWANILNRSIAKRFSAHHLFSNFYNVHNEELHDRDAF